MKEALAKLKQLTQLLEPPALSGVTSGKVNDVAIYTVDGGTSIGFPIHHEKDVAIQRVFMSKGSTFLPHKHDVHEWVVVYRGKYMLNYKGEKKEQGMGDMAYFEPGEPHSGVLLEDTWILAITIPADKDYP